LVNASVLAVGDAVVGDAVVVGVVVVDAEPVVSTSTVVVVGVVLPGAAVDAMGAMVSSDWPGSLQASSVNASAPVVSGRQMVWCTVSSFPPKHVVSRHPYWARRNLATGKVAHGAPFVHGTLREWEATRRLHCRASAEQHLPISMWPTHRYVLSGRPRTWLLQRLRSLGA